MEDRAMTKCCKDVPFPPLSSRGTPKFRVGLVPRDVQGTASLSELAGVGFAQLLTRTNKMLMNVCAERSLLRAPDVSDSDHNDQLTMSTVV